MIALDLDPSGVFAGARPDFLTLTTIVVPTYSVQLH